MENIENSHKSLSNRQLLKPIIVGLEPAGGQEGPALHPKGKSGARLARLCGMSDRQFLFTFHRVNLHEKKGVHSSRDQDVGQRLSGSLQGRRVIALGRRVQRALWIVPSGVDWFRWEAHGATGTTAPHPSGLNRWWNDYRNVRKARNFWQNAASPCVHVEGPDGSGKTRLVKSLAEEMGLELVSTENPPTSWAECQRRIKQRIAPGIVCDRSSGLLSELVYGPVLREMTIVRKELLWKEVRAVCRSIRFVYCRREHLAPTFRDDESPEHVAGVKRNLPQIARRYDYVMQKLANLGALVLRYDWSKDSLRDLAERISPCVV